MLLMKYKTSFNKYIIHYFVNESCICLVNGKYKGGGFVIFKLPLYFFLYFFRNGVSFLFLNYFFFKKFLNNFFLLSRNFNFYSFRIKFRGLGFRLFYISKNLYKFFFISTNFFYIHMPSTVMLKRRKRRLFFLGNN
jgi:hypothetical protein